jgi:hypothetical protein
MSKRRDIQIPISNLLNGSKRKKVGYNSLKTFVESLMEPQPITLPAHNSLTTADLGKFVVNYNGEARVSFLDGADPGQKGEWSFEFGTDLDLPVPSEWTITLTSNPTSGNSIGFSGYGSATFGSNVTIGATLEESRNNLLTWISNNLNPGYSQTHIASGTDTIILTLDGNANNYSTTSGSSSFINFTNGPFNVTETTSWTPNIYSTVNSSNTLIQYYDNDTRININLQALCSTSLATSWNVKNWYGYNFPVTKEDWAAALAAVVNQNLSGQNQNVVASSLGNTATIIEDTIVSQTYSSLQYNPFFSYGGQNIIYTEVNTPASALPNRLRYPVLGILSNLSGGVATIETPELVDYELQSDHNFIIVDLNNFDTAYNDFFLVWDNGEIIKFVDLSMDPIYSQVFRSEGTFFELLSKTYMFKALEEGLAGEKIRLDKFPIFSPFK